MLTQHTLTRLHGLKLDGLARAFEEQIVSSTQALASRTSTPARRAGSITFSWRTSLCANGSAVASR